MTNKPIFKSKRFISALVGVLLMVLVAYVPEIAPFEARLVDGISEIVLALIAGYSITDIAGEWLGRRES